MRTIVVSAVSLRKGGTLTILRECLAHLSQLAATGDWRIVALVHKKALASYPRVEYIEMPLVVKSWLRRLWCEYVTMHKLSQRLAPVYLWLSLHDTTPRVEAERRAVYCQTSFPFLRLKGQDFRFDYKIVLFALLTRYVYRINIFRNRFVVVQTEWMRREFVRMFRLPTSSVIVAPPERVATPAPISEKREKSDGRYRFLVVATPDCHKNFETVCRAVELLAADASHFLVTLTVSGRENRYSQWLYKKWGRMPAIRFAGAMDKARLFKQYAETDALIFPSRVETWGLPITEFAAFGKPMLLANLPYAHETAAGCSNVAFFESDSPQMLASQMKRLSRGDASFLQSVEDIARHEPMAQTWKALFEKLLH